MDTRRFTSRFREAARRRRCALEGAAAFVLLFRGGCFDVPGNDPNVPDELPQTDAPAEAASACERTLPSSCSTIPSYANDIAPLVVAHCLPCHAAGGTASDRDLTTYANVAHIESTVLSQVYACLMPPSDAGADAALTTQERDELLQWLVCGSPDN